MKNILLISVVFLFSCTSQKKESPLAEETDTKAEIPNPLMLWFWEWLKMRDIRK